jgi:multidrug efflux pump
MNISRPFIVRPVATSLLMIALVLIGLVAVKFLPVSSLPDVDYPTIQVQTFYPGASPQVMATTVTAPLEVQLGEIPSLTQMTSTSSAGASVITLQFNLALNLDIAEQNVQQAINAANSLLPTGLPAPPVYAKINPADQPILTLAVTSDSMSLTQLQDVANNRLASKISEVPGVGLVTPSGGNIPAVRVEVDPQKLAGYGLNVDDIRTLLANINVSQPKGNFDGPELDYTINANDQIQDPNDYLNTVIAYQNGAPVFMRDVARVTQAAQDVEQGAWFNHVPAIVLNVMRQPGANVIATVNQIKAQLPQLLATLPQAMHVEVVADSTGVIRASVSDAAVELSLSIALVVLVIFVFLRNVPATLIPSISVPVSLVGTLAVMYQLNYSIDNLSLMALIIATGFVVDDSIVMIENIVRYLEEGMSPLEAAIAGAGQIGFTIMSLTISLIAVLIPLLFMGGVIGRLFSEFAVTLAVTIVLSAVVSLTLVPMMCARILRRKAERTPSRFERISEGLFDRTLAAYERGLTWVLRHQSLTLTVAVVTVLLTGILCRDGRPPVATRGRDFEGSGRDLGHLVHRHRRHQHDLEQRPLPDQLEGPRRSVDVREADRGAPAERGRERLRNQALPAARAGSDARHRGLPQPVSVRAPGPEPGRLRAVRARTHGAHEEHQVHLGCDQRPRQRGIERQRRGQPAARGPLRDHAGDHRQRAVRRARPANRLHHLQSIEPVPRGAGGQA